MVVLFAMVGVASARSWDLLSQETLDALWEKSRELKSQDLTREEFMEGMQEIKSELGISAGCGALVDEEGNKICENKEECRLQIKMQMNAKDGSGKMFNREAKQMQVKQSICSNGEECHGARSGMRRMANRQAP